ncbi:MAG: hypothetical protein ABL983_17320 [Nitrospira sp.]
MKPEAFGGEVFLVRGTVILLSLELCFGLMSCAKSGDVSVVGSNSTIVGPSSTVTVGVSPSISIPVNIALGDEVARAAANAAKAYLGSGSLPIQPERVNQAIDIGVEGGLSTAIRSGRPITPEQKHELKDYVTGVVKDFVSKGGR